MSQNELRAGELEAGGREHHDDDAPQLPDDEAEELGEDRPAEVAARDRRDPRATQNVGVLGVPAVDPAAGAVGEGDRRVMATDAAVLRHPSSDGVTVVVMAPPQVT